MHARTAGTHAHSHTQTRTRRRTQTRAQTRTHHVTRLPQTAPHEQHVRALAHPRRCAPSVVATSIKAGRRTSKAVTATLRAWRGRRLAMYAATVSHKRSTLLRTMSIPRLDSSIDMTSATDAAASNVIVWLDASAGQECRDYCTPRSRGQHARSHKATSHHHEILHTSQLPHRNPLPCRRHQWQGASTVFCL